MNTTSLTKLHHEMVAVTERAESAEAELLAVREDNHSMMLEIDGLRTERDRLAAELQKLREQEPALYVSFSDSETMRFWATEKPKNPRYPIKEFYAAPVPAVAAPAVLDMHKIEDQLLLAETEMLNAKAWAAGNQSRTHIGFAMTAISCARALLQSAQRAPAVPAPSVPEGCAIVSRTLTPGAWKRLCNADIWPVTQKSFQRMLDVLMEVALLQSADHSEKSLEMVTPEFRTIAKDPEV